MNQKLCDITLTYWHLNNIHTLVLKGSDQQTHALSNLIESVAELCLVLQYVEEDNFQTQNARCLDTGNAHEF